MRSRSDCQCNRFDAGCELVKVLGETGNNVMMRLMGLILMVIAVECFVSGLKPILVDIVREGMIP